MPVEVLIEVNEKTPVKITGTTKKVNTKSSAGVRKRAGRRMRRKGTPVTVN